jgi:hypothetical protein
MATHDLPGPTMMTGTEGSAGSLKLDARGRTRPSRTPPGGVAAMVAEAAPLCTRPATSTTATRDISHVCVWEGGCYKWVLSPLNRPPHTRRRSVFLRCKHLPRKVQLNWPRASATPPLPHKRIQLAVCVSSGAQVSRGVQHLRVVADALGVRAQERHNHKLISKLLRNAAHAHQSNDPSNQQVLYPKKGAKRAVHVAHRSHLFGWCT